MEQPLVTVLVTTYNQERYIRQALDGLRAQGLRVLAAQLPPPGLRAGRTLRYQDGGLEEVSGAC